MISKNLKDTALKFNKDNQGKIALQCKVPIRNSQDLTLAYTPGVVEPCLEINKNYDTIYDYTARGNWVAIMTNGTSVLGFGNIGVVAAIKLGVARRKDITPEWGFNHTKELAEVI